MNLEHFLDSLPPNCLALGFSLWKNRGKRVSAVQILDQAQGLGDRMHSVKQVRGFLDKVAPRAAGEKKWLWRSGHEIGTKSEPENEAIVAFQPERGAKTARNEPENEQIYLYTSRTRCINQPEPVQKGPAGEPVQTDSGAIGLPIRSCERRPRPGDLVVPVNEAIHVSRERFAAWYKAAYGVPFRDDLEAIDDWSAFLIEQLEALAAFDSAEQCALFMALVGPWVLVNVGVHYLALQVSRNIEPEHRKAFCLAVSGYAAASKTIEPRFWYDPGKFISEHWPKHAAGAFQIQAGHDEHRQNANELLAIHAQDRAAKMKQAKKHAGSNKLWFKVQDLVRDWEDAAVDLPGKEQRQIAEAVSWDLAALKGKGLTGETVYRLCADAIEAIARRDAACPNGARYATLEWARERYSLPHPRMISGKPKAKTPPNPAIGELESMAAIPEVAQLREHVRDGRVNASTMDAAIQALWDDVGQEGQAHYSGDDDKWVLFAECFPETWKQFSGVWLDSAA